MTASEPVKFIDEEMQAIEQVRRLVEDATRDMTAVQRQAFLNVALGRMGLFVGSFEGLEQAFLSETGGIEFDVPPYYGPDYVARRPVPPLPPKRGGGFSTAKDK